jgi:hypothetical protein
MSNSLPNSEKTLKEILDEYAEKPPKSKEPTKFPPTPLDLLWEIYSKIQGFIEFAEKKHDDLLRLNSVTVIGGSFAVLSFVFFNHGKHPENSSPIIVWSWDKITLALYLANVVVSCAISSFFSLAAKYSQTDLGTKPNHLSGTKNFFFWGTIAEYDTSSVQTLINDLKERYYKGLDYVQNENAELDLATQLIATSQIAKRKFSYFNKALRWTMSGLLTPLAVLIRYEFFNPDKSNNKPASRLAPLPKLKRF